MSVPPADASLPETALLLAVPALDVRWVHTGAQQLNLLPTPITSASNSYEAFSESESSRIELRWQSISESDRLKTIKLWGRNDGEGAFQSQGETIKQGEKIGHDEKVTDGSKGCDSISRHSIDGTDAHSVGSKVKSEDGEEHLDPDVDDMSSGEDQINKKYHALLLEAREKNDDLDSVQGVPVSQQSYSHELATALSLGSSGEEKIKYTLPSKFGEDLGIIFEDSTKGRIVTSGTLTYITRLFWSSLKARPAGTYVYRGYSAARSAKGKPAADTISTLVDSEEIAHVNNESNSYEKDDTQDRHLNLPGHKMRSQPVAALDGAFNDVKKTAGQAIEGVKEGLRDYDLREEQRQVPALGDSDDERRAVEEENAPLVHDTEDSNPCTDLILVVHGIGQQLAAQYEAYNFVYAGNQLRQVLRKQTSNPAVASIIRDRRCQLGSALVAHILSNQPTKMPRISQLPKQVISETRDRFLFNISNLFLVGSPLGIFLHLEQAQLMPRKGRERTMHSPADEALDRAGRFGCLAVDSLYNVFYHTDPVAYQLNAAVDSQLASQRPPLAITSMTAPFYAPVADSINSISKYLPVILGGGGSNDSRSCNRPGIFRLPSGIEMAGPDGEEKLQGSRGERRFSALNPHGNVDFFLPSAGVNEYLDMLTAHLSYWTDSSFAAFLLTEIFSTRLDVMRTGMGLAHQPPPENGVDVLTSIKLDAPR
ncbi:phospholipase [Cryptococcus deuterogattii 2001/935-1]|nr:phospholipase [Cryptococcus deuterogattii 2001/935-1]